MEEVKATILLLLAIGLLYGAVQKKHRKDDKKHSA
jgi:hypothetical protein